MVGGTTVLYRAVSQAEARQLHATGRFEAGPSSLGGKWFAETPEHARLWGDILNGVGRSTIIEVELPASRAVKLMRIARLDGIGPARYAELDDLAGAVIREHKP